VTIHIDRGLRFPKSAYFPPAERKSGIAIHHTVGATARSTYDWWTRARTNGGRPRMVGTAYLIDHDGTVFEVFEPGAWAYQFGLRWLPASRIGFEQRFIGIELASEGPLLEVNGALYCFDRVSPRTKKRREEAFDFGRLYRGYRWFDRYENAQLEALGGLVNELCERFEIPRRFPDPPFDYYGDELIPFEGVIGHANVRRDKSDPAPMMTLWNTLQNHAGVRPTPITTLVLPGTPTLSRRQLETLFAENVRTLDQMDVAGASLVKALLIELERRDTHIRLENPAPGGHRVEYQFVKGVRRLIGQVARALGFKTVTDDLLEVHGG
jgi:hypothetical protein